MGMIIPDKILNVVLQENVDITLLHIGSFLIGLALGLSLSMIILLVIKYYHGVEI